MFLITNQPIDINIVIKNVSGRDKGSLVLFLGKVRDHSKAGEVVGMEYESYNLMAEKKLEEIGKEINNKWGVSCSIIHRIGRLDVGDISVAIATSAPHRKEAFEACQYAINRIKEIVPIWKKEFLNDGTSWVEGKIPK